MNARRTLLAIACVAAFAGTANAERERVPLLEPDPVGKIKAPELKEFRTPGYTLITDEEFKARQLMPRLAKFERLTASILKHEPHATGVPTLVYALSPGVWRNLLDVSHGEWHEFLPGSFVNYLLISTAGEGDDIQRNAFGVYTRFYLHTQFRSSLPHWFEEGLAQVMSRARFYGARAQITPWILYDDNQWLRVDKLFALPPVDPDRSAADEYIIARTSWVIVHRALIAEPDFGTKMFRFLAELDRLEPLENAAQEGFGTNLATLDAGLREFLRKGEFATAHVEIEPPPRVDLGKGRRLSGRESLEALARMLLDTRRFPERPGVIIDAISRLEPKSLSVALLEARHAVIWGDDETLERVLAKLPPLALDEARDVGLILEQRWRSAVPGRELTAVRRASFLRRGFALLDQALTAEPDDGAAACAYSRLAVELHENLEVALERLAKARDRYPENGSIAVCTARVIDAQDEPANLEPYLLDVLRWSNVPQQRTWAGQRLSEVREVSRQSAPQ